MSNEMIPDESIYIPYPEAKKLNGLGYDLYFEFYKDSDEGLYDMRTPDDAPCILWGQVFKWFRNNHNLFGCPTPMNRFLILKPKDKSFKTIESDKYDSYEEAELACLRKLIDLI